MSELTTAARPYARAAYAAACEGGADEPARWLETLTALARIVENDAVKSLIGDLRYSPAQVADVLKALLDDAGADGGRWTGKWNFVRLLAANRRLVLAGEIARLFGRYAAEDEQLVHAEVVTAQPLDEAQLEAIRTALSQRIGRRAELSCGVDASLLGGALVRVGDLVIDGSLRARLKKFAAALS